MTTEPDQVLVATELAELRRVLDVGITHIDGRIALLTQRDKQADKDVSDLGERVSVLEHHRWPLPSVAALTGLSALAITVWQATAH